MDTVRKIFTSLFLVAALFLVLSCSFFAKEDTASLAIYLPESPSGNSSSRSVSVPSGAAAVSGISYYIVIIREKDGTVRESGVVYPVAPGTKLVIDDISVGEHSIAIAAKLDDYADEHWVMKYYGRETVIVKAGEDNVANITLKPVGSKNFVVNFNSGSSFYDDRSTTYWFEIVMIDEPSGYEGFSFHRGTTITANQFTQREPNELFWEPGCKYTASLRIYSCSQDSNGDDVRGSLLYKKNVPFSSSSNLSSTETLTINVP